MRAGDGVREGYSLAVAAGIREERWRLRRRMRRLLLVGIVFSYGLLQVWMGAEAARRGTRVSTLHAEIKALEVDLTVARARLESRQIYGELMTSASDQGFGTASERRTLELLVDTPPELGVWDQVSAELHRGSRFILREALARDAEGRARADRP